MYRIELNEQFSCLMAGRMRQSHGWEHDGSLHKRRHLLVFVIDGRASFAFDGKTFSVERGDVLFIPCRTFYTAVTEESCEYFFFHIVAELTSCDAPPAVIDAPRPFSFALPPRDSSAVALPNFISTGDNYPTVYARLRECIHEATAPGTAARMMVDLDVARSLVLLSTLSPEARAEEGLPAPLDAALAYVRTHLRRSVTTADLCAAAHVSPSYLARLFKRHLHTTPTAYINREKMHYARELLYHTDMTVTEIAEYLAFCDVFYFSRQYKGCFGVPPTAERGAHAPRVSP